jgi:hypothetical protein
MTDILAQAGGEALGKAFEAVAAAISRFAQRRRETRESQWEELLATLDMVQELTSAHLMAVRAVGAPVLESGDVEGTIQRLNTLVNNSDFPTAYDEAKGVLTAALSMKKFRGGDLKTNPLKRLLTQLTDFQFACFMLDRDGAGKIVLWSYPVSQALNEIVRLWSMLTMPQGVESEDAATHAEAILSGLRRPLQKIGIDVDALPPMNTAEGVVEFVRSWCQSWQRHVQDSLYGGRGLNRTIGQLRFMSREVLGRRDA